ncbi:UNVERIFIED_CONTAM: hypothetical protein Sradi_6226400 [Sesamum radiatum]|uniref:Reverse transcriptase n=1 Tax=Sesamum radiatum TaxID=300843 RepID=A0AAW2KB39_SESRA
MTVLRADDAEARVFILAGEVFGIAKVDLFSYIWDSIWKRRLRRWKERNLPLAGKKILIKAVVFVVPTYAMRCFKLPNKVVLREIEASIVDFWWESQENRRAFE